jgi:hypothetical protein
MLAFKVFKRLCLLLNFYPDTERRNACAGVFIASQFRHLHHIAVDVSARNKLKPALSQTNANGIKSVAFGMAAAG